MEHKEIFQRYLQSPDFRIFAPIFDGGTIKAVKSDPEENFFEMECIKGLSKYKLEILLNQDSHPLASRFREWRRNVAQGFDIKATSKDLEILFASHLRGYHHPMMFFELSVSEQGLNAVVQFKASGEFDLVRIEPHFPQTTTVEQLEDQPGTNTLTFSGTESSSGRQIIVTTPKMIDATYWNGLMEAEDRSWLEFPNRIPISIGVRLPLSA